MSLELQGKVTGRVVHYESRSDSTNDGKTARVKIQIRLDEEQATALGGKLFGRTCFSDFVGKSSAIASSQKKPDGELKIKAEHSLVIDEYPISTKPAITNLQAKEGERAVVITVRLDVPFTASGLRRKLDDGNGDDIEIEFKGVTQPEIPGSDPDDKRHGFEKAKGKKAKANGNGADDDDGRPEPMFDDEGNEAHA